MKRRLQKPFQVVSACLGLAIFVIFQLELDSVAQGQAGVDATRSAFVQDDADVPSAALLTDRGRQLAQELRNLKRSQSLLGAKHPTLPMVKKKIDAIKLELKAWAPSQVIPEENPFDKRRSSNSNVPDAKMNERDLRQLVLRLSERIETLERRVKSLESKLK